MGIREGEGISKMVGRREMKRKGKWEGQSLIFINVVVNHAVVNPV